MSVWIPLISLLGVVSMIDRPSIDRNIYDFQVKNIDGQVVQLSEFRGNVLLIANTASECGYTPQYEGLETLFKKYKDKGLVILAIPANNFGGQEPGSDQQIKSILQHNVLGQLPPVCQSIGEGR
jgi:glutathione peroxidase